MELLQYKFQISDTQEKDNRYDCNNESKISHKFGGKETLADI